MNQGGVCSMQCSEAVYLHINIKKNCVASGFQWIRVGNFLNVYRKFMLCDVICCTNDRQKIAVGCCETYL